MLKPSNCIIEFDIVDGNDLFEITVKTTETIIVDRVTINTFNTVLNIKRNGFEYIVSKINLINSSNDINDDNVELLSRFLATMVYYYVDLKLDSNITNNDEYDEFEMKFVNENVSILNDDLYKEKIDELAEVFTKHYKEYFSTKHYRSDSYDSKQYNLRKINA